MSNEPKDKDGKLSAEEARKIILSRRARFMAAALAGLGSTSCDDGPSICLSIQEPPMDAGPDGGPRVCLSMDGGPKVCLSALRPDGGWLDERDASADASARPKDASMDTGPQVCLTPLLRTREGEDVHDGEDSEPRDDDRERDGTASS